MECPRCDVPMDQVTENNVTVDICKNSCGGLWFDNLELKKLDEKHEVTESFYKKISPSDKVKSIDVEKRLNCPSCKNIVMLRNFFSVKREIEVDNCGNCGGYWLDVNELTKIHEQFKTEEDRKNAASESFKATFSPELAKMKLEGEEKLKGARKIANALKFICPSYYIKGNQDGGAF